MKMRRTLFESGRYEQLTTDDHRIHIPRENVDEHIELFANNNTPERRLLELTFGGQTAIVRIDNVVAIPTYGDILCDDKGEIGAFLSAPKRADTYGLSSISASGGNVALPPSVRVGDVICADTNGMSHYAVVVHSGHLATTSPALPDGEFEDWRFYTRMDDSNYRKGSGLITLENDRVICSCDHGVLINDRIVADAGGRPCLLQVESVIDVSKFTVSGDTPRVSHVEWWHLPATQEIHLSLTWKDASLRRLQPGVQLMKSEVNVFGERSVTEQCGSVCCTPAIRTPAEQNVMRITLRPNSQRSCILSNICIGLNAYGILSCKADKVGVAIGGYVCASTQTKNLILR